MADIGKIFAEYSQKTARSGPARWNFGPERPGPAQLKFRPHRPGPARFVKPGIYNPAVKYLKLLSNTWRS